MGSAALWELGEAAIEAAQRTPAGLAGAGGRVGGLRWAVGLPRPAALALGRGSKPRLATGPPASSPGARAQGPGPWPLAGPWPCPPSLLPPLGPPGKPGSLVAPHPKVEPRHSIQGGGPPPTAGRQRPVKGSGPAPGPGRAGPRGQQAQGQQAGWDQKEFEQPGRQSVGAALGLGGWANWAFRFLRRVLRPCRAIAAQWHQLD